MSLDASVIDQFIYIVQIVALLWCLYMLWKARKAINGLGRGVMLLVILLIVRRLDDALAILDSMGVLILSSLVVIVFTFDVYQIYKLRWLYEMYFENRKARIDELEKMYYKSG